MALCLPARFASAVTAVRRKDADKSACFCQRHQENDHPAGGPGSVTCWSDCPESSLGVVSQFISAAARIRCSRKLSFKTTNEGSARKAPLITSNHQLATLKFGTLSDKMIRAAASFRARAIINLFSQHRAGDAIILFVAFG